MKKIFKNNLFTFIIGGIIFGTIGVGATALYNANQVSYNDGNVKDALDELYSNLDVSAVSSTKELFSYMGPTSSGVASSFVTKSYKYKEEDINNGYKYLVFTSSSAGATSLMYDQISSLNIPKGILLVSNNSYGNTLSNGSIVYIINAKDLSQDETVFTMTFRGLFIVKLIGIK